MKLNKEKITKENIYKFIIDKENKSLITTFLCFLGMILIFIFVPHFWLKLVIYYIFYFILIKFYDKAVNFLFRDIL